MDASVIEALRSVIQEELQPVKNDLGTVKSELGTVKSELVSVKEDVGTLKDEVGSVKDDVGSIHSRLTQIQAQLDRMEANQNDDVMALLQHIDGKLTNFRNETQANFKTLSRRITAIESDLSETMVEVDALKRERKQPQV